jgi:MFS family permease
LLAAAVASATPERARGRAYGLTELVIGIADIAAPLAAGLLYGMNHRLPLAVAIVASVPVAVAALVVHHFRRRLAFDIDARVTAELPVAASMATDVL